MKEIGILFEVSMYQSEHFPNFSFYSLAEAEKNGDGL